MIRILKALGALLLVMFAGMGFAEEKTKDQLIQTLMQKSGMTRQIEQIPLLLQAVLDQQQESSQSLTQDDFKRVSSMARQAFDAKAISGSVRTYLGTNLSERDIKAALVWLESPLGKKITKLEEDASTPTGFAEMQSMAPELMKNNEGTARLAKFQKLDRATRTTESSVNSALNTQLAMMTAMSAAMDEGKKPSYEEIQDYVSRNKAQVRASVEQAVLLQFLYSYRALTDAEIDKYIGFAESESGKKYHAATFNGLDEALLKAARKMGTLMGMRMNNKDSL